jgi:hypothetical protein
VGAQGGQEVERGKDAEKKLHAIPDPATCKNEAYEAEGGILSTACGIFESYWKLHTLAKSCDGHAPFVAAKVAMLESGEPKGDQ